MHQCPLVAGGETEASEWVESVVQVIKSAFVNSRANRTFAVGEETEACGHLSSGRQSISCAAQDGGGVGGKYDQEALSSECGMACGVRVRVFVAYGRLP